MMATIRKNLGVNAQPFANLTNGFFLSQRFKGAFKTALALVITYGIVLSMGWKNPYWAAFAVAFCSLATAGESLHKGLLRVAGTFVAFFLTLAPAGVKIVVASFDYAATSKPSKLEGFFASSMNIQLILNKFIHFSLQAQTDRLACYNRLDHGGGYEFYCLRRGGRTQRYPVQ